MELLHIMQFWTMKFHWNVMNKIYFPDFMEFSILTMVGANSIVSTRTANW